jgi:hypothetical protein
MVKEAMAAKEAQMIALGARLLITGRGNMATATEITSDREATTSVLSLCVSNISEAYSRALQWCGRYVGDTSENAAYTIDQDFGIDSADSTMLAQLLTARMQGVISSTDVRMWMRVVGLLNEERDDDTIQQEVDAEGANAPTQTGSGFPDGTTAASVADAGVANNADVTLA